MNDVIWRAHPVYSAYELSSDGRIRSVDRVVLVRGSEYHGGVEWYKPLKGRELKQHVAVNGYMRCRISVDGKSVDVRIHRLVCETFHGLPTAAAPDVRHLNGIQTDNRADNLCWGTKSENMLDKQRHGTDWQKRKTHCPRGHALNGDNVHRRADRPGSRECLTCKRANDTARHKRNRLAKAVVLENAS